MSYYPDLSPCEYFGFKHEGHLLSVGWLDGAQEFSTGSMAEADYRHLKRLIEMAFQPVIVMGSHDCNLCQFEGARGSRNLFLPDNGKILVASDLILHYINCHHYLPPDRFLTAMRSIKNTRNMEYKKRLLENNGKFLLASNYQPKDTITDLEHLP